MKLLLGKNRIFRQQLASYCHVPAAPNNLALSSFFPVCFYGVS